MTESQIKELLEQWEKMRGGAPLERERLKILIQQAYVFGFKDGLRDAKNIVSDALLTLKERMFRKRGYDVPISIEDDRILGLNTYIGSEGRKKAETSYRGNCERIGEKPLEWACRYLRLYDSYARPTKFGQFVDTEAAGRALDQVRCEFSKPTLDDELKGEG